MPLTALLLPEIGAVAEAAVKVPCRDLSMKLPDPDSRAEAAGRAAAMEEEAAAVVVAVMAAAWAVVSASGFLRSD